MKRGWEQEAHNWLKWARTSGHDAYWYYAPSFFEEVVPRPAGLALEIGCGEGRVARDLREQGHDIIGLDASPTLVQHAVAADPESSYVVAEAEILPFGDSMFDLVVAYNSLMDVEDMAKTVREAARVLKRAGQLCVCITHPINDAGHFDSQDPDAHFVITDSYYGKRRLEEKFERDGLELTFRSWLYPLGDYMRALEQAGFLIELVREPRPSADAVARRPTLALWQRVPMFLFLRAIKRDDASG